MRIKLTILIIAILLTTQSSFAEMMLFVGEGCPHCEELENEMQARDLYTDADIKVYEIYYNQENKDLYLAKSQEVGYTGGGVPLIIDGQNFFEGKDPILAYLERQEQTPATIGKLSEEDSETLANILDSTPVEQKPLTQKDEANIQTLGLIIIVAALTLFITILLRIFRARR